VIGTGGAEQSRGACYLVGGTEPATTESGRSRTRRLAGTHPSLSHHRGGGEKRRRVLGAAMAMATAPEPMGVAEGKLAMALVPMDAARQRLGGEN